MRVLATLAVSMAVTSFAVADIAIPPPKGKKFVPVSSTVKLEKEIKGYTLFTRANAPGQRGALPKQFDLNTEKAVAVPDWGGRNISLYAVPDDMVAKLKTADDWNKALFDKKSVIQIHDFPAKEEVSEKDERKKIERAFVIKGVDEKGIKVEEVKGEKADPKPEKKEEKKLLGFTEPGYLIGGIALAVGVTFGGLWLVRRKR